MFDLHFHSNLSDGAASLSTIASVIAARPDLTLVALADHDRVDGSIKLADHERRAWVAAELTAFADRCRVDILALNVDPTNSRLTSYLSARASERVARFMVFGKLLRRDGWTFEPDIPPEEQLTNAHVAAEIRRRENNHGRLTQIGVPISAPGRGERDMLYPRLLDGYGPEISSLVPTSVLSSAEAVVMIRAAGGLSVVAHPWVQPYGRGNSTKARAHRILDSLVAAGLDGIEIWHPQQNDPAVQSELRAYALPHNLLLTAGSDDHSADAGYIGSTLPPLAEAPALLDRIVTAARTRRNEHVRRPRA